MQARGLLQVLLRRGVLPERGLREWSLVGVGVGRVELDGSGEVPERLGMRDEVGERHPPGSGMGGLSASALRRRSSGSGSGPQRWFRGLVAPMAPQKGRCPSAHASPMR